MKKYKNCDVCANNNKSGFACDFCVKSCNFLPVVKPELVHTLKKLKENGMEPITRNDYLDALVYAYGESEVKGELHVLKKDFKIPELKMIPALSIMLPSFIKNVIFNDPATIVFWLDGTKTVVKAVDEPFDKEKGLAMAICKKIFGNKGNYFNVIKEWTEKED